MKKRAQIDGGEAYKDGQKVMELASKVEYAKEILDLKAWAPTEAAVEAQEASMKLKGLQDTLAKVPVWLCALARSHSATTRSRPTWPGARGSRMESNKREVL